MNSATKWRDTRIGFFLILVFFLWIKTCFAYMYDLDLPIENPFQSFILWINPLATSIFLLSIALYIRRPLVSYITMLAISIGITTLVFSNIVYFREFSDFITINTMLGSSKVSAGLGDSAKNLFRMTDIIYYADDIILIGLLVTKKIKIDPRPFQAKAAIATTSIATMLFSFNLMLAETSRPGLLKRTFSHTHIVKYLGIPFFTGYDGYQTYTAHQTRAQASPSDLVDVTQYVKQHQVSPDPNLFGIAEGKNVIYIHLESFQQFLLDYQFIDEEGTAHEVTPFLNQLYHSPETYSFDNFFHQVKSGKTSDAETLLENSFFGLSQGPLFTQLGDKNTFQAAPAILSQKAGYTSAVFHGNNGNFWNRNDTYKRLGYDYFFDSSYYDVTPENSFQYGLHDKPFFKQSVEYLEHLQQPFYTKFIAVSNHYPYSKFTDDESGFPLANTNDATINGYFATANYLDKAVEEFYQYLDASGLLDHSILVLYGDHYGISNSRNPDLAELVGKDKATWADFDNAMMQRVPLMFHIPGETNGSISHTYGGQVDVLPTLLHLLGIDTTDYIHLGQDLFSKDNQGLVAFRNGDFVSKDVYSLGDKFYNPETGELYTDLTPEQQQHFLDLKQQVELQLRISDSITTKDLLRYYEHPELEPINPLDYNYKNQVEQLNAIEQQKGSHSTSLFSNNHQKTTQDLYQSYSFQDYLNK